MSANNTLAETEPHPSAFGARAWVAKQSATDLMSWRESFASCAIEGNRMASICGGTLDRLMHGQPVSDRYVLGLAWFLRHGGEES